ncbi:hypothetical protein KIPB_012947, partial [Kipferlia bialata]
ASIETPEAVENMADICGYYLMPYSMMDDIRARYGVLWANGIKLDFTDDSFDFDNEAIK